MEVDTSLNGSSSSSSASSASANASSLQQLWLQVQAKPDFDSLVKLVGEVEKTGDISEMRKAFSALLNEFPLCFGYWQKWSNQELKAGDQKKAFDVLEQGVQATPHSHELWQFYADLTSKHCDENEARSIFNRALATVGLDYKSGDLWDSFIAFETKRGNLAAVAAIYQRVIQTPLEQLDNFWNRFKVFLSMQSIETCFTADQIKAIMQTDDPSKTPTNADKVKLIAAQEAVYNRTLGAKRARDPYEQSISRPYFHVQPLEPSEIATWHNYLDFEEKQTELNPGNLTRLVKLYDRCLVACAQYPEFWCRYATYIEKIGQTEKARNILHRATSIFVKNQPEAWLEYANLCEIYGPIEQARFCYQRACQLAPGLLEAAIDMINFERRQEQTSVCVSLYEAELQRLSQSVSKSTDSKDSSTKATSVAPAQDEYVFLSMHYSRFLQYVLGDVPKAREVLNTALGLVTNSFKLWLATIAFETNQLGNVEPVVSNLYSRALSALSEKDHKETLWRLYADFLADRGMSLKAFKTVQDQYKDFQTQSGLLMSRKRKPPADADGNRSDKSSKAASDGKAAFDYSNSYAGYNAAYPGGYGAGYPGYGAPYPGYGYPAASGATPYAGADYYAYAGQGYGY